MLADRAFADAPWLPSGARIVERCAALARCSSQPDGLTRVFLSAEHAAANALVLAWMREAGMRARVDAIGNVVGRFDGGDEALPCLMLGSHLDTVRDAGRYDGMLGIVSAIECVHALAARGASLPFAIEVIAFGDEEGVRFDATLIGSRAVAGTLDMAVLDKRDHDGVSLRDALTRFGGDPGAIASVARRRDDVLAYVELHIEQGPVLEAEGLAVGVVTAINGATRMVASVRGTAGHAGTVPMPLRRDALAAAAECMLAIETRCAGEPDLVGTVGRIDARPGAVNVIPGDAVFSIDIRAPDDGRRNAAVADVERTLAAIGARRRVDIAIERVHEAPRTACAPWLVEQIGAAIESEGVVLRALPSGAGHDGMALAAIADVGMLFVRCTGGVSHHPAEDILEADAGLAARVLLRFIERFRDGRGD